MSKNIETGGIKNPQEDFTYRKVALRIIPLLMICYIIAYLDRVNVSYAKLQMNDDLKFSDAVYGFGTGLFFIGYFFFEVPSNMLLHRFGARAWIARIMITWGILSGCFAFIQTDWQYYILRFMLGVAEAGFYPGVILYLTFWFPSHRRGKMFAMFQIGAPAAGIFGSPLSGWIMEFFHNSGGWEGWRWMFLIECVPAIILGVVVLLYLDNSVKGAKWLSDDQKTLILKDIEAESHGKTAHESFANLLKNRAIWVMALIYFCFVMGQYGMTLWLPDLVKSAGVKSTFINGLLTAIPYICAIIAMVIFSRSADKRRERRWHLVIPALMGAIGFIAAATAPSITLSIIFLSLATAGVFSCAPLFWSLPTAILSSSAAAAGIAMINSIGNLAGFVSPSIFGKLKDLTGSPVTGMYVLAACLVVGAAIVLTVPAKKVNK